MTFRHRPDHPDFWIISEGLIEQDAQAESDPAIQNIDDVTSRYVDLASVSYVAFQRALRIMGASVTNAVRIRGSAMWMDGFVQGVRFQIRKQTGVVLPVNLAVQLVMHHEDGPPTREEAVLLRITGSGEDRKITFQTTEDDLSTYEWDAYRFEERWAYGSSADKLEIVIA